MMKPESWQQSSLHSMSVWSPNKSKRQRAMESLLFLTEKRDKTIKSQHCANGSTQHTYMECDKVTSLTISMEGTLLTAVIKAQEG